MLNLNYEAQPYNPSVDFPPIPEGIYTVSIEDVTERESGSQAKFAGVKYLAFKLTIISGAYEGRLLFENVHINNPNDKTRIIARRTLDGIAYALNFSTLTNSDLLLRKPFKVRVKLKDEKNRIAKYYKMSDVSGEETKNPTLNHTPKGVQQTQPPATLQVPSDVYADDCPF